MLFFTKIDIYLSDRNSASSMKRFLKRRGLVIDKISEDSFYANLMLGLPSFLKKSSFVTDINLERISPPTLQEIYFWEYRNAFVLPIDLRHFFLSTNGFSFSYKFHYERDNEDTVLQAGLHINPLAKLEIVDLENTQLVDQNMKIKTPPGKVFNLATIDENNDIVLAQFNVTKPPSIWLFHNKNTFYYFCDNIVTYLRMAIAHLCAPGWQSAVLKASLPEWSSEMLQILAPGIFDNQQIGEKYELNKIDSAIFDNLETISTNCEEKLRDTAVTTKKKTVRSRLKK